jgi:hypothetical protein
MVSIICNMASRVEMKVGFYVNNHISIFSHKYCFCYTCDIFFKVFMNRELQAFGHYNQNYLHCCYALVQQYSM